MSELHDLAALTLCTGVHATGPDDAGLRELEALAPGGVVLFARNVTTPVATRELSAALRAALGGDPLICIDQEGGRVARVRFGNDVPSMLSVAAAGDLALAERAGARLGADVASAGGNVDFAPVLDLGLSAGATAFGTRTFGDDAARVAELGVAVARGIASAGVAVVAKHFPGHGESALDPHVDFPVIGATAETLRARDLVPFAAAIASGVEGIMSAHAIVRAFDTVPATLSRAVLQTLLRDEYGFSGITFTDCMQMDAIGRGVGTVGGVVAALRAGADSIVVSHDLALARAARDAIVAAVAAGELSEERLRDAAGRVRALRATLAARAATRDRAARAADRAIGPAIARAAMTLVRGEPALTGDDPITVISFEGSTSDGIAAGAAARPSLNLALRRRRIRAESMRVPLEPDAPMREMLADVIGEQLTLGGRRLVLLARRAHLYRAQRATIELLLALSPDAIAVSMLEPFDVPALAGAKTVLCTFGDEDVNVEALADVLAGRERPRGTLPVSIEART